MPFNAIGFCSAAPGTGTPIIPGSLNDQKHTVTVNDIWLKTWEPYLLGVLYAAETTPGYAELRQNSLVKPYMFVKSCDLNDPDPIKGFSNLLRNPLPLHVKEPLNAYSNNATDEDTIIGLLVGTGIIDGDGVVATHKIRGYADQTLTALTWTEAAMTWDQSLEAGRYLVVGMEAGSYISSGFMLGMARLILQESVWRPGVPFTQLAGDKLTLDAVADHPYTRWPEMPEIYIEHDSMPNVEFLSPGALTDHVVELTLKRISG